MRKWSINLLRLLPVYAIVLSHVWAAVLSMAVSGCAGTNAGNQESAVKSNMKIGARLPDAPLMGSNGSVVRLTDTTGRVKLINVVPTVKALISESQTRHLSEALSALESTLERVTVSANTAQDQEGFARQANIRNMTFLSDAPSFAFGSATGLWVSKDQSLHRAVIVADRENVIRYFEVVPVSQLPQYDRVYQTVRQLTAKP